jgi:predicted DNA-binding protein
MPNPAKRSYGFKVNVTPELHERLREVAAQLGQAPATIASMAIGSYVAQLSNSLGAGGRMVDAMAAQMAPEMQRQMQLLTPETAPKKALRSDVASAPAKKAKARRKS